MNTIVFSFVILVITTVSMASLTNPLTIGSCIVVAVMFGLSLGREIKES